VPSGVRWPHGSLEHVLNTHFARGLSVSDVIFHWLGEHSTNPWALAGQRTLASMAARGVLDLEVEQKKVLKLFTVTSEHYLLPARTSAGVSRQSAPAGRSLEAHRRAHPEVHDRLTREIGQGIDRRLVADYD
jgi:hypothetical protein